MFKRSIFSKIFGLTIFTAFTTGVIILAITLNELTRIKEEALIRKNALLSRMTAGMIEVGYLNKQWPFEVLKSISEYEDIVFLWVVKADGEIYYADDSAMLGKHIEESELLGLSEVVVKDAASPYENQKIKLIACPLNMDLGEKPWSLILGVSLKSLRVAQSEIVHIGIIVFVLVIGFISLISFYFSRGITNPLKKLREGARLIGRGKTNYQLKISTGDEIEELSKTFNRTARNLEKTKSALEEQKLILEIRVKARTRELEELNKDLENKIKIRTRELQGKVDELEEFNKLITGRELKMIELKEEIERLKDELKKYKQQETKEKSLGLNQQGRKAEI